MRNSSTRDDTIIVIVPLDIEDENEYMSIVRNYLQEIFFNGECLMVEKDAVFFTKEPRKRKN